MKYFSQEAETSGLMKWNSLQLLKMSRAKCSLCYFWAHVTDLQILVFALEPHQAHRYEQFSLDFDLWGVKSVGNIWVVYVTFLRLSD
jgi:hypothetical protein